MSTDSCAICGRTILKGERTRTYLTPEGESHDVCELCRGRAEALGWIWETVAAEQPAQAEPEGRRAGLGSRLRGRARRAGSSLRERARKRGAEAEPQAARSQQRSTDPAAAGASVRSRPATTSRSRVELALEEFNRSEHAHRVAGLIRTLGEPQVTIGNGAGEAGAVRITVAWELTWYQWVVQVSGEHADVRESGNGQEISELDASARQWNGHANGDGRLRLGRAPAEVEGEPATQ
jgi:hypothetical protein